MPLNLADWLLPSGLKNEAGRPTLLWSRCRGLVWRSSILAPERQYDIADDRDYGEDSEWDEPIFAAH